MITNSEIIEILRLHVPTDKRIPVKQIHNIVKNNYQLTAEDWSANPSEIETSSSYDG